jgi:hypothetical protein
MAGHARTPPSGLAILAMLGGLFSGACSRPPMEMFKCSVYVIDHADGELLPMADVQAVLVEARKELIQAGMISHTKWDRAELFASKGDAMGVVHLRPSAAGMIMAFHARRGEGDQVFAKLEPVEKKIDAALGQTYGKATCQEAIGKYQSSVPGGLIP